MFLFRRCNLTFKESACRTVHSIKWKLNYAAVRVDAIHFIILHSLELIECTMHTGAVLFERRPSKMYTANDTLKMHAILSSCCSGNLIEYST